MLLPLFLWFRISLNVVGCPDCRCSIVMELISDYPECKLKFILLSCLRADPMLSDCSSTYVIFLYLPLFDALLKTDYCKGAYLISSKFSILTSFASTLIYSFSFGPLSLIYMDNFMFPSMLGSDISGLIIFLGCFFFQEEDY